MNKKNRVIIFGTGWAFNNYIKNYRDENEIVGITDWEFYKHGDSIQGILVINPYEFSKYEFDYILIISFYVNEIKQQLWEKCKIGVEKILVPPKFKIKHGKPFEHTQTADFARTMIFYLSDLSKQYNVKLFLDYGTLLGFIRDGNIIKWDDDIDFSINKIDTDSFIQMLKENINVFPFSDILNWYVTQKITADNEIRSFSILFKNKKSFYIYEFEIGIRVRQTFENLSVVMYLDYLACYKEHFEDFEILAIDGKELCIPKKTIKYLQHVYGNWETPKMLDFGFKEGNFNTDHLAKYKVTLNEKRLF